MAIHSSAIIEEGARLEGDVNIGPFCVVGRDVILHEGVRLISHVSVTGHTEIGARTTIYPQTALGGEGQIRNNNFQGRLVVGEDCVIREGVTLNVGSKAGRGLTRVGNRCYLMAYAHVGHDCNVGDEVTFANSVALGGHVEVGDAVIFGGLSTVQQRGRVGKGAIVGGVTGVNRDVIPYGMAFGAHVELAGLNLIGLERRNLSKATINAMRAAFREIFLRDKGTIAERTRLARDKWPDVPEIGEIADFILADAHQPLCTARRDRIISEKQ